MNVEVNMSQSEYEEAISKIKGYLSDLFEIGDETGLQ